MNESTKIFDKLVSKALDSNITEVESNELKSLLNGSKDLQKRYCKTILIESLFHWEDSLEEISDKKIISFPLWPYVASVAAIFVCIFSAWIIHSLDLSRAVNSLDTEPNAGKNIAESNLVSPENYASKDVPSAAFSTLPLSMFKKSIDIIDNPFIERGGSFQGTISIESGVTVVSFEQELSTSTSNGVMPLIDGQMLQMNEMEIDPVSQESSSVEILRIYDLNDIELSRYTDIETSIHINQSYSETSDPTEFVLSLHALAKEENHSLSEIGSSSEALISDNEQSTWEKIDVSFSLPEGTDYLVVSLTANKSGLGALKAHQNKFFADELELTFARI